MSTRNVFTKWLWDGRRSLTVWAVALCAVGGMYAALWPTINDPDIQELLDSYPEGLLDALSYDDVSTASGYLSASVYGLLAALLLLVYAINAGARAIAGEEQAGEIELLVTHPVGRKQLALQRFGAVTASVALITFAFWLLMISLRAPAQLTEISIGGFAAMHIQLALFAAMFGAISFALGAATGRRSVARGLAAGFAVLGFLANGLIPQIDGLGWVQQLSPFDWLSGGEPLRNGLQVTDCLVMVGIVVTCAAIGTWRFNQRDIGA